MVHTNAPTVNFSSWLMSLWPLDMFFFFSEVNVTLNYIVYKLFNWHLSTVETLIEQFHVKDTDFDKLYSIF